MSMRAAWAPRIRHVLLHQRPIFFFDQSSVQNKNYWTLTTYYMTMAWDIANCPWACTVCPRKGYPLKSSAIRMFEFE